MKDVVVWLTGLSKLVPLHSWNGFNNPCMMVENVGRPVEVASGNNNAHLNWLEGGGVGNLDVVDAKYARQVTRNSRRVYSDLGFSSNLMELMAGTDDESEFRGDVDGVEPKLKSRNRVSSSKFSSERFGIRGKNQAQIRGDKRDIFHLRRNNSAGGTSEICARSDDVIPRTSFHSHGTDDL